MLRCSEDIEIFLHILMLMYKVSWFCRKWRCLCYWTQWLWTARHIRDTRLFDCMFSQIWWRCLCHLFRPLWILILSLFKNYKNNYDWVCAYCLIRDYCIVFYDNLISLPTIQEPRRVSSIPKRIVKISAGYHHSAAITGLVFIFFFVNKNNFLSVISRRFRLSYLALRVWTPILFCLFMSKHKEISSLHFLERFCAWIMEESQFI